MKIEGYVLKAVESAAVENTPPFCKIEGYVLRAVKSVAVENIPPFCKNRRLCFKDCRICGCRKHSSFL